MPTEGNDNQPLGGNDRFTTTHWPEVLAAVGGDLEARNYLCHTYWRPIFCFVRRMKSKEDSEDIVQSFFCSLLGKNFGSPDQAKGRFRTYLLVSLKNYMENERKHNHRQKRGGGQIPFSLDIEEAEAMMALQSHESNPDQIFKQQWAGELLTKVRQRLEAEYDARDPELYKALRPWLTCEEELTPYVETAQRLNRLEPAVRQAARQLRKRFGRILIDEVRKTVSSESEIEAELADLFSAFASSNQPR